MYREAQSDNMNIEFSVTDESFDHEFGREKRSGFEVTKIEVFIPAINDWIDFSHTTEEKIIEAAKKLAQDNIGDN